MPDVQFGDANDFTAVAYSGDETLRLQTLLPDDLSFDMAGNIFLLTVALIYHWWKHIMEHGLLFYRDKAFIGLANTGIREKEMLYGWLRYCQ